MLTNRWVKELEMSEEITVAKRSRWWSTSIVLYFYGLALTLALLG